MQRWIGLVNPSSTEHSRGIQGFLRVTIFVLGPSDSFPVLKGRWAGAVVPLPGSLPPTKDKVSGVGGVVIGLAAEAAGAAQSALSRQR